MIARYDNFGFRELPDLSNQFYLVSTGTPLFTNPQSISFNLISPTKKTVHIHGATTPFYLSMSEAYHDQWQAEFDNSKVNAGLAKWSPFAKPDLIPASDHFKLDDFLNGWYIDTPSLCGASSTTGNGTALCTKNPDGSYDMNLVIEFWPQRYFYLGLIISGATLAGCVGYLIYAYWPGRGKKKVIKLNVVKTPANSEPILKPKVKDIIHPTEPPLPPPTE
jgi:hypothetical protein